ncbi:hypothetical protein SNE40_015766 [Patella caerulea]|uniref:Copper transport protein n=1 Tax=Patella caerulea TaxID=87958 RepID=A0AAN8JGD5_PATCE
MDNQHDMPQPGGDIKPGMMMSPSTVLSHRTFSYMLTDTWLTSDIAGIGTALVFSFSLALFLECVKFYLHLSDYYKSDRGINSRSDVKRRIRKVTDYFIRGCWHGGQVLLANVIMLCVMTYNIWILACVCLGSGVGFFLARPIIYDIYYHRASDCHGGERISSVRSPSCSQKVDWSDLNIFKKATNGRQINKGAERIVTGLGDKNDETAV